MPVRSRTVTEFAAEMRGSITNWYAKRGLAGNQLRQYADYLQGMTNKLRDNGASKDQVKQMLAREQAKLLQFGLSFNPSPKLDSSLLVVKEGGLTKTEETMSPESRESFVKDLMTNAYTAIFKGSIASEGHYAGLGTRLESSKPKFNMDKDDLISGLRKFHERTLDPAFRDDKTYKALKKQIDEAGGIDAIAARYGALKNWTLGERIFLAKIYDIFKILSKKFGVTQDSFRLKLHSLKFKIVVNSESGGNVIESFVKNRFFGLNPYNVIFLNQAQYATSEIKEDGALAPDERYKSQGNHGLIPIQANLENQWFRVIPDRSPKGYREEVITTTDYKDFQSTVTTLVVESVEDTSQYVHPYDYTYLAYVEKLGREMGVQMFMKIVGQKTDNPQKGGFLATATYPAGGIDPQREANVVIESNRAPDLKPEDITHLNQNRNAFFNPNGVEDTILSGSMVDDLHPTIEPQGKEMLLRVDPKIPQGDRNLHLKTQYIMDDPAQTISNLKDPVDILPTLRQMEIMESNDKVVEFAAAIGLVPSRSGNILISSPFKPPMDRMEFMTNGVDVPLTFAQVLNPDYLAGLTETARDHLKAAQEMCKVVGSFVRRYDIDPDGKVYVQTIEETRKGKGLNYQTNALQRTLASDSRATIARNSDKVYVGNRRGYDLIELPNRQGSKTGEIVTFIVEYKDLPEERLKELFAGKIRRVIEMVNDNVVGIDDMQITDLFLNLTQKEMLSMNASSIAIRLLKLIVESQ